MELSEKLRAMEYELSLLKTAHLKLSEGFYLLTDRVQRHEMVAFINLYRDDCFKRMHNNR